MAYHVTIDAQLFNNESFASVKKLAVNIGKMVDYFPG